MTFTKFRLFGYPFTKPELWFLLTEEPYLYDILIIWCLPWQNLRTNEVLDAINQFTKLIELPKAFLITCPSYLSDKVSLYAKSRNSHLKNVCSTYMYYMDEKQQERILKKELSLPHEYYYNDDKPEEDAAIISSTLKYAIKRDCRSFTKKLQILPNVIIRHQGKPVAYEIFNINGTFHHHFVHEEHRRQGLGGHVELRLSQKVIREGFWPCKMVEKKNELVVEWSNRSPHWNRYNDECGDPIITCIHHLH